MRSIIAASLAACAIGVSAQPVPAAPATAPSPSSSPAAPAAAARAGTLKEVRGQVELSAESGRARAALPGEAIMTLDRIVTGPDSGAGIVLRDGTTVVIGPSSQLLLKEYDFEPGAQTGGVVMALVRGSLRVLTGMISRLQPDNLKVDTPAATIGVRGTDFIVIAEAP